MKKRQVIVAALAAILSAGAPQSARAQLSDILGAISGAAQKSSSGGGVLSTLGGVITGALVPKSAQIVGTWAYQGPAVMFTSDDALKSAASAVASKQVETKLQGYLDKAGMKAGKTTVTFQKDKTFYITRNGKRIKSGTYALNGSDVQMTFKGRKSPSRFTPQLDNGTLVLVADATRLKTLLEGFGSQIPQLATVTSLMKGMKGMMVGLRMTKGN